VDYSRPQPSLVDWTESYPSEGAEERARDQAISWYSDRMIWLFGYALVSAAFSSYFLNEWREGGGDQSLFLGLVLLAFFGFCATMLFRELRDAYSGLDETDETPSHEDAESMYYDATNLPPRR
jgi:hypothetical protein